MDQKIEKIDLFLSYLSEIHTKSLTLYDLITERPKLSSTRMLLTINETFTYYHSARIFYYSNAELQSAYAPQFFKAFEDFYFELKQLFFLEDDNNAVLYHKLTLMKEAFEELTDNFNVL